MFQSKVRCCNRWFNYKQRNLPLSCRIHEASKQVTPWGNHVRNRDCRHTFHYEMRQQQDVLCRSRRVSVSLASQSRPVELVRKGQNSAPAHASLCEIWFPRTTRAPWLHNAIVFRRMRSRTSSVIRRRDVHAGISSTVQGSYHAWI